MTKLCFLAALSNDVKTLIKFCQPLVHRLGAGLEVFCEHANRLFVISNCAVVIDICVQDFRCKQLNRNDHCREVCLSDLIWGFFFSL